MQPSDINQLLDAAKARTGSDYRTAKLILTSRQRINDWRTGRQPTPLADVALIAQQAGLVPEEWLARAVVAQHEGTEKGEALARALKKWLPAIGAAIASSTARAADLLHTMYKSMRDRRLFRTDRRRDNRRSTD